MNPPLQSLTGARLRQLDVLAIVDRLGTGNAVTFSEIQRALGESTVKEAALASILTALRDEGALILDERAGGAIADAKPTPRGREIADEFVRERASVPARRRAARDAYLYWLYDELEVHDRAAGPTDFERAGATFAGIAYDSKDIEKAGEWLAENGYIRGPAAWQYSGPLRPELTAKGKYTVEHGRSTDAPPPEAGNVFNTTVNGQANIAQASTNFSQSVSIEWTVAAHELLDSLEQAAPTLGESVAVEVRSHVNQAREALTGPADKSVVRGILTNLHDLIRDTSSGALGALLATQIATLLSSLQ